MHPQARRARMRLRQEGRTTSTSTQMISTTRIIQPTTVVPLSATFTPPPQCWENRLSLLPPPAYRIWANEPAPLGNTTATGCYPEEFLQYYTSVSSSVAGSSVVPAMSPLVCPANFCTALAGADNYAACCPFGYTLHLPDTTSVSDRPGYGGTCYSDLQKGSTYTVTAYATDGATNTMAWVASTSGAQAYAHPIDGFALLRPTIGCPNATTSNSSLKPPNSVSISSISSTITPISRNNPSGGAIAGFVIGSVVGLAIMISLVVALLRFHRKHKRLATGMNRPSSIAETATSSCDPYDGAVFEKDATVFVEGPFEVTGDSVPELDSHNDEKDKARQLKYGV